MDDVKSRVVDLNLNDVLPNRFQPRIKFSEDSIIELSESIKEHGVIQPIVVRPIGDKYEIIAGERRYKASVLAGKETIPAIITDLNDKDSAEVALIENVQRKDLTAIEEAISYKKILDMGYLTQEQLAIKLGRSQSTIANKLRLLNLCDEVQEALMQDKISERHARSMLKLPTAELQRKMLDKIIKERLTVRKTDEEIDKMNTYITNPIEQDQNQTNPGFMNVDNIVNNAQDLNSNNQVGKMDMNALLQGGPMTSMNSTPAVSPSVPNAAPEMFNQSHVPSIPQVQSAPTDFAPSAPVMEQVPLTPVVDPIPAIPTVMSGVPSTSTVEPIVSSIPEVTPVSPVDVAFSPLPEVSPISTVSPIPDAVSVPAVEPVAVTTPSPVFEAPVAPVESNLSQINSPVQQSVNAVSEMAPIGEIPTITPISPMPTTPIVEESLPSNFSEPSVEPETTVVSSAVEPVAVPPAEPTMEQKVEEVPPIIITDYSKQYDPVLPTTQSAPVKRVDFKQIINLLREVNTTIEKCGYSVETEEYDLEGIYQVVIKINKGD